MGVGVGGKVVSEKEDPLRQCLFISSTKPGTTRGPDAPLLWVAHAGNSTMPPPPQVKGEQDLEVRRMELAHSLTRTRTHTHTHTCTHVSTGQGRAGPGDQAHGAGGSQAVPLQGQPHPQVLSLSTLRPDVCVCCTHVFARVCTSPPPHLLPGPECVCSIGQHRQQHHSQSAWNTPRALHAASVRSATCTSAGHL